jgi:hypothetical protein
LLLVGHRLVGTLMKSVHAGLVLRSNCSLKKGVRAPRGRSVSSERSLFLALGSNLLLAPPPGLVIVSNLLEGRPILHDIVVDDRPRLGAVLGVDRLVLDVIQGRRVL